MAKYYTKEQREMRAKRFLEHPQTPIQFVKAGKAVEVDGMYLTDNDKIIYCIYGTTIKWHVEGDDFRYRNFFDAYYGDRNR